MRVFLPDGKEEGVRGADSEHLSVDSQLKMRAFYQWYFSLWFLISEPNKKKKHIYEKQGLAGSCSQFVFLFWRVPPTPLPAPSYQRQRASVWSRIFWSPQEFLESFLYFFTLCIKKVFLFAPGLEICLLSIFMLWVIVSFIPPKSSFSRDRQTNRQKDRHSCFLSIIEPMTKCQSVPCWLR